jgi:FAD/FMN-containing dehydrogenase
VVESWPVDCWVREQLEWWGAYAVQTAGNGGSELLIFALAVLRAEQLADVIAGVNFARDNGLELSIRNGGHSGPGFGTNDRGLVIDMTPMRTVHVDQRNKTARAGAGATLGDFNHATHAFGLATTGGIISTTGLTGLTLGGGIGYLSRAYGLSIHNLLSADVVTADGMFLPPAQLTMCRWTRGNVVSEGGLEPPCPVKGTSTSS